MKNKMVSGERDRLLQGVKEAILSIGEILYEIEGIGIFGSLAAGNFTETSDIDIFIVLDSLHDNPLEEKIWTKRINEVLGKFKRDVTVLFYTLDLLKKIPTWHTLSMVSDGIIVFDRNGKVKEVFDKILKAADKAGLHRVQRGDRWVWSTKKPLRVGEIIEVFVDE